MQHRQVITGVCLGLVASIAMTGCARLGIAPPPTNGNTPYADMMRSEAAKNQSEAQESSTASTKVDENGVPVIEGQFEMSASSEPEEETSSNEESSADASSKEEKKGNPPKFVDKYHIGAVDEESDITEGQFSDAEKFVRRLTVSDVKDMTHGLQLTQIRVDPAEQNGFTKSSPPTSVDLFNYFIGRSQKRPYKPERVFKYRGVDYYFQIPIADIENKISADFQWAVFDYGTEEFQKYMAQNGMIVQQNKLCLQEWPVLPETNVEMKLYKSVPLTFSKVRLIFMATEVKETETLQVSEEDGLRDSTLALPDGSDTKLSNEGEAAVDKATKDANLTEPTSGSSGSSESSGSASDSGLSGDVSGSGTESNGVSSEISPSDGGSSTRTSTATFKYYPIVEIELSNMNDYKYLEYWTNRN